MKSKIEVEAALTWKSWKTLIHSERNKHKLFSNNTIKNTLLNYQCITVRPSLSPSFFALDAFFLYALKWLSSSLFYIKLLYVF